MTTAEIFGEPQSLIDWRTTPTHGPRYGPWTYHPKTEELVHDNGYPVDLEASSATCAALLDGICQVASKTWADGPTLRGLMDAVEALIHPQGSLCSGGVERRR